MKFFFNHYFNLQLMSDELLRALNEAFPSEGVTIPFIELKFRYAGQYGMDKLESMLKELVDKEIMTSYEFNGSLNYKTLKDLPLNMDASTPVVNTNSDMNKDLISLLSALAAKTDDPSIIKMADDFLNNYSK